jgi:hypothetical protein
MVLIYREGGSSFTARALAMGSLLRSILRQAVGAPPTSRSFLTFSRMIEFN